ncbi:MAG: 3-phosphoshikimate 1-carboxyvinyltransferase [Treponema sp.]|nr:3-phosphoshikimate 1-carboxyvinyltransferase [Treponema sp.]MCL2237726.1 3-phosphoshikimate 1-carboxyvinyltransferase [Treponema sp.]
MNAIIKPRRFNGTVRVPASKSHTIRQLLIASLADGVSTIKNPLDSLDTRSCIEACKAFGAEIIEKSEELWEIKGNNGFKNKIKPGTVIDVGNSGTTLYLALALAGLQSEEIRFVGDEQIQKRSAAPLLDALAGLGVLVKSNNGCAPITIKGPWNGGKVTLICPTSQYLSALLIASPLAPAGTVTEIDIPLLNEKPYVEMTLSYLKTSLMSNARFAFKAALDYSHFFVLGGSQWKAFGDRVHSVPGDFSSAAFPAAAAAITGGAVRLIGLNALDTQGDKYFFEMLKSMGCDVYWQQTNNDDGKIEQALIVSGKGELKGGTFDLNNTPDLLPAAAVTAAFANGDTSLVNVGHARIKETDRIAVMAQELAKLGVSCTELPEGIIIHGKGAVSPPENTVIEGHGDHRIVMAFAAAALGSPVPLEITTAESAAVTYPGFLDLISGDRLHL